MNTTTKLGLGARLRDRVATLRHYHEVAGVGEIARRYFAMNAFDGVLTALGVLAGGYLGGVDDPRAIVTVMLTTAVGMGVSGFYGSYLVERAERGRAMRELEESTLSSLRDTSIASASRYATIVIAVVDGASPFLAALIVMTPFFFTSFITMHTAYYVAAVVALVELFALGAYLGSISRERLWLAGLRLVVAGFVALGISLLLGGGVQG